MLTWQAVEILGQSYYAAKGFRVLISQVDASVYDFVIENDKGEFFSVNVKCAVRDKRCIGPTYSIGRKKTAADKVPDFYLVWFKKYEKFLELPGDFLKGVYTRNIPRHMIETLCNG